MRSVSALTFAVIVLASILVAALIWAAGDILALFFVAFMLAYLFDPLAGWMVRRGTSRPVAALIITAGLIILLGGALALVGPIAYAQAEGMLRGLQSVLMETLAHVRRELAPYLPILRPLGLDGLVGTTNSGARDISGPLASVVSGGIAFAGTLGLSLLAPVLTFYLLKDWPRMMTRVLKEIPPKKRPAMRHLAHEIDQVLSGFLHGQAWVCICVSVLYTIGFSITGVKYAIVLGLIAGALKFLPYVGTAIACVITFATAISQSGWDGWIMSGIALTFLITELIESSILSPRIIGNRVQMAPALVIFAVLLGGKLLGVIGVFIAIPVFAVARVLFTFWLKRERADRTARQKRARLHRPPGGEKKIAVVKR